MEPSDWKRLGEGGYGEVYLSQYKGIDVAVKIFRGASINDDKSFKQEITTLRLVGKSILILIEFSQVRHPNIVLLYGACTIPHILTVIEYVSGGSLKKAIYEKKIGKYQKLTFAKDIVNGLTCLHNIFNIVHHDIKPDNILVFFTRLISF